MAKQRVALITESTARKPEPTPAYLFYQGSYNKWVNSIIQFMDEREFPRNDAYFVSYNDYHIYGYEDLVDFYEKAPNPNSKERKEFANIIIQFLEERYNMGEVVIELHLSKLKFDKLIEQFQSKGYEYRLYADVPLGEKPKAYEKLIMEEKEYRRLRDVKREKYNIIHLIPNKTPDEAKNILDQFKTKAHLYGVEDIFEELKLALKDYWQAKKASVKAKEEAIRFIEKEDYDGELEDFVQSKKIFSDLFQDIPLFESLNQKYGKTMAKIERYLMKTEYLIQKEYKIRASLLRLQIVLIKG
ncbi:hypothetical protein [Virgibacillus halodenitrificans]|uniref:hypothetical protein n=1 Tax=Virgibacillus halodenitrificans TaxID=1482 RepID=UPI000EF55345|nr:hypothetical protein [Virgibacillus halodenitrificans]